MKITNLSKSPRERVDAGVDQEIFWIQDLRITGTFNQGTVSPFFTI